MSYDSLVNRGDYFSAHYLAEVLPKDLKKKDSLLARWTEREKNKEATPRSGLRALRKEYFKNRAYFADFLANIREGNVRQHPLEWRKTLHELHGDVLRALGFDAAPRTIIVERADKQYEVSVAHAEPADRPTVIAIECGWAPDVDAALDPEQAGLLLAPVDLDDRDRIETGDKLATWLFACDEPPRYVLVLAGGVIILADRATWGEGRYLAVSLDVALGRGNAMPGEIDTIAALFGADSLLPPEEGGTEKLAELLTGSRQHAVGVSEDLRDGLRDSIEIIANEVLDRIREQGVNPREIDEPAALAKNLGRQALRYLYRILFLLYAEARPELGVLPSDDEAYVKGYSMARIGDLIVRDLVSEESRRGFHLYESLDLLFDMVNRGHNHRNDASAENASEGEGLRFEPLKADLFEPSRTSLIGEIVMDEDAPDSPHIDTRLRNEALYRVLRLLMLAKGKRKERGGFISYAQLGINQLGAVYEGLMSYTGFIADEELYEVAKNGDPKDGSWMIPASKIHDYDDSVFVRRIDENGFKTEDRVVYKPGAFVYRLAGRDRQTSASYYTPESLTQVTVQLALRERLDQNGETTKADEILHWTICEPALGSGAFLNEAINQVAAEYLKRRQAEKNEQLEPEQYADELQKAKAYIALHNSYGVDLNETAVELAEVSLWLNVMYPGLQAPWFGLHLRRGNSLIGAGRRLYPPDKLKKKEWLNSAPNDRPFRDGPIPNGHVHHFLLPAAGWGAVASEKEAKALAPEEAKRLAAWRKQLLKDPRDKKKQGEKLTQLDRLQALSRRAEYLWDLVIKRLQISEREISRPIDVWGADGLAHPRETLTRDEIKANLTAAGTPYWRLKTFMDAWCALWFWPLEKVGLLDGSDEIYERLSSDVLDSRHDTRPNEISLTVPDPEPAGFPATWEEQSLFGESPVQEKLAPVKPRPRPRPKPRRPERRPVIPLNDLDDWLDFAEALLGVDDIPQGSLFPEFDSLAQLDEHEDQLLAWMGMEDPFRLGERFPWLDTIEDIAKRQGFFHWELDFAQIFHRGGFDLQVGNPPWVRPRWEESLVLAELDPWFELANRPSAETWKQKKELALRPERPKQFFLDELVASIGVASFLGSPATFQLLAGTQPNLYRAFMVRAWRSLGPAGRAGLLHPDSHFNGAHEGKLRAAAYRHLRIHAHFHNRRLLFADIDWNVEYAVQIYGPEKAVGFVHVSWLYGIDPLLGSFDHDGTGERPGIKYNGQWDLRPHRDRMMWVDEQVLSDWRRLAGEVKAGVSETRLLYPVTTAERSAISALAAVGHRLQEMSPQISAGFHEADAKKSGLIEWRPGHSDNWSEVILRGPQFSLATPFAKQPPNMGRNDRPVDLKKLPPDAVPSTDYRRATDLERYRQAQDRWLDHQRFAQLLASEKAVEDARRVIAAREGIALADVETDHVRAYLREKAHRRYTEFYRVAWREMIPNSTERSLFPVLIPPGPAHIHLVRSMALPSNRETALVAGFWSALPLDYLLRVTGRGHLDVTDARTLPVADPDHPLANALLLRTLRLNCLTIAYGELWEELYVQEWGSERWAAPWPRIRPLEKAISFWDHDTPLLTEYERRAALVEIDAIIALMLGMGTEELMAIYWARFPHAVTYESAMWFDAEGRRIAENFNAYGHGQTKENYLRLMEHLDDPQNVPPPEGYVAPFYRVDREEEYRQAYAAFSDRLRKTKETGWSPEGGGDG
ncbi:class I SAM-dependent DNA methyltransferase [Actinomadura sp. LD22]|uniref:site-specific DNA-methyltransferase (adenine-specific) n=1 Tax=Actinomadura physcomitrii TaxID=2650748 RepID=A0A6I4MNH3_9ACTN|nr:class I SAM-dependent DNA methyltransferase [Actinomadura physcomitrii]MWA06520.1 class I SAM-dependent DNA methyltransferase [Actinomadura physcomitrii]